MIAGATGIPDDAAVTDSCVVGYVPHRGACYRKGTLVG